MGQVAGDILRADREAAKARLLALDEIEAATVGAPA